MQGPQEARPRARSPFAAAFLSLIFPGLGQLYAGATMRALAFAAPPILLLALGSGVVLRMPRTDLLGLVFDVFFLQSVFVVNLIVLLYRIVAVVDAYRVAEYLNAHDAAGTGRLGPGRISRRPVSLAGLLAVILVLTGAHVVVARYDMLALDALTSGCIFVGEDQSAVCADNGDDTGDASASGSPDASQTPDQTADQTPDSTPTPESTPIGTPLPEVSIAPWNGKDRLNILLIGADVQRGGHNTDTMITVSVDPTTKQVAMFSLPRDMTNIPLPPGPARGFWGQVYGQKINSLWSENRNRSDLWPGKKSLLGYTALKETLGNLYGLDIKYFVEVDFAGFRKVINTLGGVTVNVQVPIVDDTYPGPAGHQRLYIPSGLQHMSGADALQYARSRHTTNDFDRSARQQRLLLSLREQADPQALIPRLPDLVAALKSAVKTDIPVGQLDELLGLASQVDTSNITSYVFQPPLYGSETAPGAPIYKMFPNVSRIRSAVRSAFNTNPVDEAKAEALANEGAQVWVLNPYNDRTRGPDLAQYLEYRGLAASAPRQRAPGGIQPQTSIVAYNGAETQMPETVAFLEKLFKVKVTTVNDPAIRADIVVTIGADTPNLIAPPLS